MAESMTHIAVIDEMEEGTAVVLFDEGPKIMIPRKMLPKGSGDGTVLKITIEIDEEEKKRRVDEIRSIQERLLRRTRGQ